eukprot:1779205-Rhodomonas_salina.2
MQTEEEGGGSCAEHDAGGCARGERAEQASKPGRSIHKGVHARIKRSDPVCACGGEARGAKQEGAGRGLREALGVSLRLDDRNSFPTFGASFSTAGTHRTADCISYASRTVPRDCMCYCTCHALHIPVYPTATAGVATISRSFRKWRFRRYEKTDDFGVNSPSFQSYPGPRGT